MKKPLFTISALGLLAFAVPAAAQSGYSTGYGSTGYGQNYDRGYSQDYGRGYGQDRGYGYQGDWNGSGGFDTRLNQTEIRIQDGIAAGTIDRREAYRLRARLNELRRLEARYSYNGLTQAERSDLQQRLRMLRQDMRIADGRRDDDRYGFDDQRYDNGGRGYYGSGGP
jgi:hypothetical protein